MCESKKEVLDNLFEGRETNLYVLTEEDKKKCNLDVKKLIKYAKETNNKKALDKLLILENRNYLVSNFPL